MPDLAPQTKPTDRSTSDPDIDHDVCEHDVNTALCGTDVTDAEWVDTDLDQCVVCADLCAYYDRIGTCCHIGERGEDA